MDIVNESARIEVAASEIFIKMSVEEVMSDDKSGESETESLMKV